MNRISIDPFFSAWRRAARALLQQGVEPSQVEWIENGNGVDAGNAAESAAVAAGAGAQTAANVSGRNGASTPSLAVPRDLLVRLKTAACCRVPDRWGLLYRILWRWTHGDREAIHLTDADGALLDERVHAVESETMDLMIHTRFRRRDPSMGWPEFVGWYEPRHDLLERAAARFVDRMGDSTWMLATPQGAAFWNGMLLRIGRPVSEDLVQSVSAVPTVSPDAMSGEAVTSEATEALWLAHYASVFNSTPAPVPLRYWCVPAAGPPLPAQLARARSRRGAQSGVVTVPAAPPVEYSAMTPPLREHNGPLATCRRCALWRNAKQAVAGVGSGQAAIMVVGEQPGEHENQHGTPFSGPAGQLLDSILARAGLERETLYLTYAVKHYKWETPGRQPGQAAPQQRVHRPPARREVEACQFWLDDELARVAPRVVVTLGATALKALTGAHVNLSEYLGQTIAHGGRLIVPAWHPAYALRTADVRLRDDIVATIVAAFAHARSLAANSLNVAVCDALPLST
ncbi:putative DNA metabolism protein [Paraburkholderia sp. GAS199]|uniref:UdgX family uracil-DNA binding protein n=1 Tax=Paraburkholderia sp. GAS199 TaxID=3035126 RepID=UPI003D1D475F